MSANAAAPSANKPANTKSKGLFGGLFGSAKKNAPNVGSRSAGNTNSNEAIAKAVQQSEVNAAKATPSWLPTFLGGRTKAGSSNAAMGTLLAKPHNNFVEGAPPAQKGAAAGVNESAVAALNASLAPKSSSVTELRSRTRKQRGGAYRGKTMRLPGSRNVLRVTGKTARKLGRVGVYGLKKIGNGVHVVTGLLGGLLKKGSNVVRKTMKMTRRNRKQ
jgi:hypothetical protein